MVTESHLANTREQNRMRPTGSGKTLMAEDAAETRGGESSPFYFWHSACQKVIDAASARNSWPSAPAKLIQSIGEALTEELAKRLDANLKSLSVKSALNPALWLVAVTFGFGLIGLKYFAGDVMVRILLVAAIGLPILVACIAFLYFVFKQPERLQMARAVPKSD